MITRIALLLLPGVASLFLAMFLLGASPSERPDWQSVSRLRIVVFRSCWVVSAGLSLLTVGMLVLRRPTVHVAVAIYAAAVVLLSFLLLLATVEQYFRWATI